MAELAAQCAHLDYEILEIAGLPTPPSSVSSSDSSVDTEEQLLNNGDAQAIDSLVHAVSAQSNLVSALIKSTQDSSESVLQLEAKVEALAVLVNDQSSVIEEQRAIISTSASTDSLCPLPPQML